MKQKFESLGMILNRDAMKKIAGGFWGCHCNGGSNNGAVIVFSSNSSFWYVNQQAAEHCWPGGGFGVCTEYTD